MKRAHFLRLLAATPFAAAACETFEHHGGSLPPADSVRVPEVEPTASINNPQYLDMVEHWSGGIRPDSIRLDKLAQTSDAEKRLWTITYGKHTITKTCLISGCLLALEGSAAGRRSELAYVLTKRLHEGARDLAFLVHGDNWRIEVERYKARSRWV